MGSINSSNSDKRIESDHKPNISETPQKIRGICESCKKEQSLFKMSNDAEEQAANCMKCLFEKHNCRFVDGVDYNDYISMRDMRHPQVKRFV